MEPDVEGRLRLAGPLRAARLAPLVYHPAMSNPWIVLEVESGAPSWDPSHIEPLSLRGVETISRPYRFEIRFRCDQPGGLAPETLDELLTHPFQVTWGPNGMTHVRGVLDSVRTESVDSQGDHVTYVGVLEPWVARARYTVRSRVFQDMDVVEIVRSVVGEHAPRGSDYLDDRVSQTYPKCEYVVQYQESDLDFIQRLMEHYGIHFHFWHDEDGVEHEQMRVGDSNAGLTNLGTVAPYVPRQDSMTEDEGIHTLTREVRTSAANVLLTDYNWRTPRVPLSNEAVANDVTGVGLHHTHGMHFKTPGEGAALAQVCAERIRSERVRYRGRASMMQVHAGFLMSLENHPIPEYDARYVIVSRELDVSESAGGQYSDVYELAVEALPYRPPERTPKPRIHGFIHGVIDAPAHSTAAPIDADGRYKVLLPFDLNGRPGGKASRWIRVAQPSSGPGFGVHVPMHLGAEVAIAHLDGDPDRPVIVGSVHNTDTKNPVADKNATQSWIQTQAGVRVLFDDDVQ